MIRYGVTIFLSAFLLFQVQPIIARFILPWFGGTAGVWTTCLMFFQILLLMGYLYSHLLRKFLTPKQSLIVHSVVLIGAAIFSGIVPPESMQPEGSENLTISIVKVLLITVGLPFFALSTTGPLVQAWQNCSHYHQSPYRLYALSNVGSMLALVTYPFLVERFFKLAQQAQIWTIAFVVFAVMCIASGLQAVRFGDWHLDIEDESSGEPQPAGESAFGESFGNGRDSIGANETNVEPWRPIVWVILSMAASIVLLATTNLMCQEVASVPFLWILPLSLYLLSFIICFDRPGMYRRAIFLPMLLVGSVISIAVVHLNVLAGFGLQIVGLSLACFGASMTSHGELERMKPDARHLTSFYLWISVGGALGGVFVCVVAPHVFTNFCEFHIGIMICLFVSLWMLYHHSQTKKPTPSLIGLGAVGLCIGVTLAMYATSLLFFLDPGYQKGVVYRGRNEYGLAAVEDVEEDQYRRFVNGSIEHGGQSLLPDQKMKHISYYVPGSGVGVAFESYRSQSKEPLNIGVLGLGAGAMTTWAKEGDSIVFFEINPIVKDIAEKYFSFLSDSPAKTSVVLGDGRIQLQKLLIESGPAGYDLLFMDAFASDSIPVHLLTRECMEMYFKHLKPDGILIAHITNRFIDLRPVVLKHAEDLGLTPLLVNYESEDKKVQTRWVLLTRNDRVIHSDVVRQFQSEFSDDTKRILWTDDYASVAALLDWSANIDWEQIQGDLKKDVRSTKKQSKNASKTQRSKTE